MGKIRVLSKNGDDETDWDTPESSQLANKLFNDLVSKGNAAFEKTANGFEKVKEFNPSASEIIITRPLVGG